MRTIRTSAEIDGLFREGTRVSHPLLLALGHPSPPDHPGGRVAFVAGKKTGDAVRRNRAKRVMRAAFARAGGPWRGLDVLLVARPETGAASPEDLDAAFARAARKLGASR